MSYSTVFRLLKSRVFLLFTVGALFRVPALAQEPSPEIEVTPPVQSVSLGEPVVLEYKILNPSLSESRVYLGMLGKAWLTLSLADEYGEEISPVVPIPPQGKQGLQGRTVTISPQSHFQDFLIVSRLFKVSRAGNYRLNVRARLIYAQGLLAQQISQRDFEKGAGAVLTKEYSFPLTITQRNPARLRALAESLRAALVAREDTRQLRKQTECLFSLPAAYAAPTWKWVINELHSDVTIHGTINEQMARFPSQENADFLGWMAWNSKMPDYLKFGPKHILRVQHDNTGDAALKQHIEQIYQNKTGKVMEPTGIEIGYPD